MKKIILALILTSALPTLALASTDDSTETTPTPNHAAKIAAKKDRAHKRTLKAQERATKAQHAQERAVKRAERTVARARLRATKATQRASEARQAEQTSGEE